VKIDAVFVASFSVADAATGMKCKQFLDKGNTVFYLRSSFTFDALCSLILQPCQVSRFGAANYLRVDGSAKLREKNMMDSS